MRQSRWQSWVEACVGTAIGIIVAILANWIVLPLFGFYVSWSQSTWIAFIFTTISLIRSYFVRRLFNWWHHKGT